MPHNLDELLERIDDAIDDENYRRALSLALGNWNNLPDPNPLRERIAVVFAADGRKRKAVDIFDLVARHYANAGFPTRALAATKQLRELNPSSTQLLDHFTTLYSVRSPFLERDLDHPTIPDPADELDLDVDPSGDDVDELFATAYARATSTEGTAERPGSLPALPLLSLLPPKALRRLLDFLDYEIYAEPEPLSGPDVDAEALFWTVTDDLTVEHPNQPLRIPAGALIGLDGFGGDKKTRSNTVVTSRRSECLKLSRADVDTLTEQFPDFPNRLATLHRHALTEGIFESHPMFEGADGEVSQSLPDRLTGLQLEAHTPLIAQNKVSPGLYILLDGSVDIVRHTDQEEIVVDTVAAGDMVGEIGLIDPQPAPASAVTTEPTHALFFAREDFVQFAHDHPPAAEIADERAKKRAEHIQQNT